MTNEIYLKIWNSAFLPIIISLRSIYFKCLWNVLYWKLTQSLSKSYPGVCLRTRFFSVSRAKLQLWSLLQFCCSRHFLLACSNLSQFLGRKNVYISLWWLKVLWFVYCWMFLMDVGYIQYYYQRVCRYQVIDYFEKKGKPLIVLFSFHLVAYSRVRSSLRWHYWFVCSHYRWIWLPCAVRSLCGQCLL